MACEVNREVLDQIVEQIVKVLDPEKIILFGSYARGEAGPDSDVDILVVADVADPDGFRSVEARTAIGDIPYPLDLVIVTPGEWTTWHDFVNTVMGQAFKYGKPLYERERSAAVVG
ncbi:MAG: nucleotidyltransferase domain-containing protein [Armatimonadetes bacterium]|nr:nucleotidyltransferase domain-containing protein [Armatimonadota bacterium]